MKKVDMRVLVTKRLLLEALIKLLKEKNVNEITIKELTDTAGINRGSFYQHYKSIDDLIDEINQTIIDKCFGEDENGKLDLSQEKQQETFDRAFDFFYQNREFMKVMYKSFGSYGLNSKIEAAAKPFIMERFKYLLRPEVTDIQREVIYYYIYGGCAKLLDKWLADSDNYTIDMLKKACAALSQNTIAKYKRD